MFELFVCSEVLACSNGNNIGFHLDFNECAVGPYPCDQNAACADTDGSFTCTCNDGYVENGNACDSKNEP